MEAFDPAAWYCVNMAHANVVFRNDALLEYATERVNPAASTVLKYILQVSASKMRFCHDIVHIGTVFLVIVVF